MLDRLTIHQPHSVTEASHLLQSLGPEAAIYAGGTELLVVMKERLAHFSHLIDIKRIPGLREITFNSEARELTIGALATHHDIEHSSIINEHFPALSALAANVANVRVRTAGTMGGNLCFAEPHSDPPTLLTALGARLTLASSSGSRVVPLAEFFAGVLETVRRHDEILTSITIPEPGPSSGIAYERIKLHERPTAAVAAVVTIDRNTIVEAQVVAGSVGEMPQNLQATNAALVGKPAQEDAAITAALIAHDEVETTSDPFESERYKRQLTRTVTRRAITTAIHHAINREGSRHAA